MLLLMALVDIGAVSAGPTEPVALHSYQPLDESELAQIRGGFVTADGLEISVGVERLLYVNGEIQVQRSFDLSGLGGAAVPSSNDLSTMLGGLVQRGDGNTASEELMAMVAAGVLNLVQNSLDNQAIQNITHLNIRVENFALYNPSSIGALMDFQLMMNEH
ncbi:MAG: hypothetical protein AB1810_06080 [Pseudomonadota bacterium]